MKSFTLLIVLSILLLCTSICRASVSCGGHSADTCANCPQGNGAGWCNGDCTWDGSTGQCKPQSVESVSCGNHNADTCANCPQGNGAAWCNGDCIWDGSTGQCKPQSVECGSNADSCAECPLESCSSTYCSWHPHTSLCRDAFSDEVRTASVRLDYDRPSGVFEPAWWFQRVIPTASADATYFSTNAHRFGDGRIQQVSETLGRVIFSLWDQGGCDQDLDPNCNAENIAETVACGTGVSCTGFAGQGTGRTSMLDVDLAAGDGDFPQVGQEYYFVTQASYLGNRRMEYTGYFYLNGEWRLLSRIQVSTNSNEDWSINGMYSFVKQWTNIDTTRDRGALFGPSFMASVDGSSWQQVPRARFSHGTLENHERVNAWQTKADQDYAVGIETGGDTVRVASHNETFDYPLIAKAYDSLGSFSKKVPCLNDATTISEIEACLAFEDYSTWPTIVSTVTTRPSTTNFPTIATVTTPPSTTNFPTIATVTTHPPSTPSPIVNTGSSPPSTLPPTEDHSTWPTIVSIVTTPPSTTNFPTIATVTTRPSTKNTGSSTATTHPPSTPSPIVNTGSSPPSTLPPTANKGFKLHLVPLYIHLMTLSLFITVIPPI